MERHHLSGLQVAKFLEAHPKVIKVSHPLLESSAYQALALKQHQGRHSGMIAFYLRTNSKGRDEAVKFLDHIRIVKRAASLGGTHSLACHPASLTHSQLTEAEKEASGITNNLIRLSVGLENVQDLISDLSNFKQGVLDA